jgi:hypothetical protein
MAKATSIRLPSNPLAEIEFTPSVWTSVTADVYQDFAPTHVHYGRTTAFDQPQPADHTIVLLNTSQNYTPQNPASPYFPNIKRRKRIRFSYNSGVQRFRFFGYIKQWTPALDGNIPVMQITARCRMDQFSRFKMLPPIHQEITLGQPLVWWPLTDAAGSTQALEQSGNLGPSLGAAGTGTAVTFGDNGPGFGDGPGVKFQGPSGQALQTGQAPAVGFFGDLSIWVQLATAPGSSVGVLNLDDAFLGSILTLGINTSGQIFLTSPGPVSITGSTSLADGGWHHIFLSFAGSSNPSYVHTLYVDGVSVGTQTVTLLNTQHSYGRCTIGSGSGMQVLNGNLGQAAIFFPGSVSSTRIQSLTAAGKGYAGDTTDQRIARWLGYAGVATADMNLDVGQVVVNTYPQDGKDVLSACQDMATTEGGGAVFYVTPDGKARFVNRRYRDNRTPKLTLSAPDDLDPSVYQPSLDDLNLVTQVNVNRASESGTQTTQTYSSGAADVFASNVTTYTVSDIDALALAQSIVNSQLNDVLRFPQIAVDLTDAGHDLYDTIGQLQIGDRIRLTNIPANVYPVATLDFFLEGWTETSAVDSWQWVADVTAADQPAPRAIWDTSTWDGGDDWTL